jgi:hypothetical protein
MMSPAVALSIKPRGSAREIEIAVGIKSNGQGEKAPSKMNREPPLSSLPTSVAPDLAMVDRDQGPPLF